MTTVELQLSSGSPLTFADLIAGGEQLKPSVQVRAEFTVPKGKAPSAGWPAVVAIHGSLGWGPHHDVQLGLLAEQGIATCKVFTFAARGESKSIEKQNVVPMGAFLYDAFMALDALSVQAAAPVNMSRVGVIGWSYGGTSAAYTAMEAVAAGCLRDRPTAQRRGLRFAAHFVLYGGLSYVPLPGTQWTGAPMEFHVGSLEDYSWRSHSERLTAAINAQCGREVARCVLYPGGHHSFDRFASEQPEHWEKEALVLAEETLIGVTLDGTMVVQEGTLAAQRVDPEFRGARGPAPTGWEWLTRADKLPVADLPGRIKAFIENPQFMTFIRFGAHIGANETLHAPLLKNLSGFFAKTLQCTTPASKM